MIVKWLRDDPSGFRTDPVQISTERAALDFLAELGLDLAPRLIAADEAARVLVLQDLAPASPLFDAVHPEGLRAFARALGRLHASTIGHAHRFYGRLPVDPLSHRQSGFTSRWRETIAAVGIPLPPAAVAEVERVVAHHAHPGPFLSFSCGDAGANNYLVAGHQGWLIDFEFAGYRSVFVDAAALYVPGSMWITVADPAADSLADGVEAAYRTELAKAVPEADDDRRFGEGVAGAALAYAVARLHRFALLDRRTPGDQSRLQMVSTLETAAAVADGHHALPALAHWARAVGAHLRGLWPDADVDLGSLPPYLRRN